MYLRSAEVKISWSTEVKISAEENGLAFATKTNGRERSEFHGAFEDCIHPISVAGVLQ